MCSASSISVWHTQESCSDSHRFLCLQRYWRLMTAIPERRLRLWHRPFFSISLHTVCRLPLLFPLWGRSAASLTVVKLVHLSLLLSCPASLGLTDESLTPAVVSGDDSLPPLMCVCELFPFLFTGSQSYSGLSLCSIMQFNSVCVCVWGRSHEWFEVSFAPFCAVTGLPVFSSPHYWAFIVFLCLIHIWSTS